MKNFISVFSALLILSMACSGNTLNQPDQVVENFIEALRNGKGDTATGYLSSALIAEFCVNCSFETAKANPEEGVATLASLGVDVSVEEMETMTEEGFVAAVFNMPLVPSQMADFGTIEIGEAIIEDETATVSVTTSGDTENFELALEDNNWKLNSFM